MAPVIDSHQHFWRAAQKHPPGSADGRGVLDADHGPEDLSGPMHASGVDGTVLVQSIDSAEENDRLAGYAAAAPFVAGIVGWLPLAQPGRALEELARIRGPRLRGVRCQVGREPLDHLERADALEVFRRLAEHGLCWDIVPVTAEQAASVARIARAVPELRIVVDHLARPPLDTGGWRPWADNMTELAEPPNVAVKVSVGKDVLNSWAAWNGDRLHRYVDRAVRCFGPRRLMIASNWPVVLLRASYVDAWRDQVAALEAAGVRGEDLDAVLGGTASHWYGLPGGAAA